MISGEKVCRYGGPTLTLQSNGRINVAGMGEITRKWGPKVDQWRSLIRASASKWGVPEAWIAGVMLQESGGAQQALSPAGAVGLMQIMPSTPKNSFGLNMSKEELWKPATNIDIGARLLAQLAKNNNWNPVHVAASYNAGGVKPFSGSETSCTHDGLWHVRENCGYSEQVVRGINAAITAGYSGTGASSTKWVVPVVLFVSGALAAAGVGYLVINDVLEVRR